MCQRVRKTNSPSPEPVLLLRGGRLASVRWPARDGCSVELGFAVLIARAQTDSIHRGPGRHKCRAECWHLRGRVNTNRRRASVREAEGRLAPRGGGTQGVHEVSLLQNEPPVRVPGRYSGGGGGTYTQITPPRVFISGEASTWRPGCFPDPPLSSLLRQVPLDRAGRQAGRPAGRQAGR